MRLRLFSMILVGSFAASTPPVAALETPIDLLGAVRPGSTIPDVAVSPDSNWVVLTHDSVADDAFELWAVPAAGGTPVNLSGLVLPNNGVSTFRITSDSATVVYLSQQETAGITELFAVPIDGAAAPQRLHPQISSGDGLSASDLVVDPHDRFALVAGDLSGSNVFWYRCDLAASVPNAVQMTPGGTGLARLSPDGDVLVYADMSSFANPELMALPTSGALGDEIELTGPVQAGAEFYRFRFTPDSARVLYASDQFVDGQWLALIVPTDGSIPESVLSTGLASTERVIPTATLGLSPNGQSAVYAVGSPSNSRIEAVPTDGSTSPVELFDFADQYSWMNVTDTHAIHVRGDVPLGELGVWSAPLDGSSPAVELSRSPGHIAFVRSFDLSPNGYWGVFTGPFWLEGEDMGFRAALDGTDVEDLIWIGPDTAGGTFNVHITADSEFVLLNALRRNTPGDRRILWEVPLEGPRVTSGTPLLDSLTMINDSRDVVWFEVTPDGRYIVYQTTDDPAGTERLFALPYARIYADSFEVFGTGAWSSTSQ